MNRDQAIKTHRLTTSMINVLSSNTDGTGRVRGTRSIINSLRKRGIISTPTGLDRIGGAHFLTEEGTTVVAALTDRTVPAMDTLSHAEQALIAHRYGDFVNWTHEAPQADDATIQELKRLGALNADGRLTIFGVRLAERLTAPRA